MVQSKKYGLFTKRKELMVFVHIMIVVVLWCEAQKVKVFILKPSVYESVMKLGVLTEYE
jgi:hypothetical protein